MVTLQTTLYTAQGGREMGNPPVGVRVTDGIEVRWKSEHSVPYLSFSPTHTSMPLIRGKEQSAQQLNHNSTGKVLSESEHN